MIVLTCILSHNRATQELDGDHGVRKKIGLAALALLGSLLNSGAMACETGRTFCVLDNATTDRLDRNYDVVGTGKPGSMTAGKGVQPTPDGMVEVFAVDGKGCRVAGGEAFFMYPEVFAFDPPKRLPSLAGSITSGASYGSGGGGGAICK
ncbi:MAG: hypothetical protein P1U65_05480 [Minwuia sp.]|nr:hypothetical protein [Minwuia sp.]